MSWAVIHLGCSKQTYTFPVQEEHWPEFLFCMSFYNVWIYFLSRFSSFWVCNPCLVLVADFKHWTEIPHCASLGAEPPTYRSVVLKNFEDKLYIVWPGSFQNFHYTSPWATKTLKSFAKISRVWEMNSNKHKGNWVKSLSECWSREVSALYRRDVVVMCRCDNNEPRDIEPRQTCHECHAASVTSEHGTYLVSPLPHNKN